jgi:hypothetical protein
MAVSKRLRYEVLRRDNHACRYCGRAAPDVPLTVDHVVPTALGGDDSSGNLVAACIDCNGGKAASSPAAPLVADVQNDALRWAAAMETAAQAQMLVRDAEAEYEGAFLAGWDNWSVGGEQVPLPPDWHLSIGSFRTAGLGTLDIAYATTEAMRNTKLPADRVWKYFCGICWRIVAERREIAAAIVQTDEAEVPSGDDA